MSYEPLITGGIFHVYDAYGDICLRTTDSEAAFRRARMLDTIERMKDVQRATRS